MEESVPIEIPADVQAFLQNFSKSYYQTITVNSKDRLKCLVTGHEMDLKLEPIKAHFQGKRFLNKCKSWRKDFDFEQYEPFIIPHKYDENKLYCALTKTSLNKAGGEVLKHVRGRRYQAALKVHEENKAKGKKKGKRKQEDEGDVEENDEEEEDEDDQEEEEEEYNDEEEEEDQGNSGDVEGGIYADELVHDSGKRSLIVIDEEGGVVFQRNKKRKKKGKKKKKKKKV